jgi:hypothetical protein
MTSTINGWVGVGVSVAVGVSVGVGVLVEVEVEVGVWVGEGVEVGVALAVAVGVSASVTGMATAAAWEISFSGDAVLVTGAGSTVGLELQADKTKKPVARSQPVACFGWTGELKSFFKILAPLWRPNFNLNDRVSISGSNFSP